jgi:serine/threonine-protein kinase
MNIREQFGKYLLLKKLAEDALGETFRAGRVGGHGMEQVVLLRVFNGTGIDGGALSAALAKRKAVHQALVSPNIGNGVDLGEVRGVPFVAYDYISGKDLAALQEQARKRNHPIPSDHALLIAERIALALAVGYETRLDDERVLHGCVLPQLVMISNEGETRLLGFEAAPGLRQVVRGAVATRPLGRYLSPEARSGAAANKSDDVYSLGAILLELLTGSPIAADGDLSAAIDHAELSSEGTPLPDDLKKLLKQSLCPQAQRIGDVITWHKALSRMMFEGQYNPTTFNLAFFMHNLFRDEIEKESREIEVEKTMELQLPPAAPAAAAAAAGVAAAAAAPTAPVKAPTFGSVSADLRETTSTGVMTDTQVRARQKSGNMKMILGAVAALLVVAAGVGWYVMQGKGKTANAAAPAPSVAPTPDHTLLQQQAAAQQAEAQRLEAAYKEMLEKQSKDLQARYDEQLAQMKKDLESAKTRAAQAQQAAEAPPPAPAPTRAAVPAATLASVPPKPAATVASAQPTGFAQPPAPAPTLAVAPAPAQADPQTTLPSDAATSQAAPSGATPPRLLSRPSPKYPPIAAQLRLEATVKVRVLVNEQGRVDEAEVVGAPTRYFDQEALKAARGTRFAPATQGGQPIKMWVELPIKFKL